MPQFWPGDVKLAKIASGNVKLNITRSPDPEILVLLACMVKEAVRGTT